MHSSFLALLVLVVGALAHDACINACRPQHEACCRDEGAPECHLFGSCDFEVTPSADPAACADQAQSECEFYCIWGFMSLDEDEGLSCVSTLGFEMTTSTTRDPGLRSSREAGGGAGEVSTTMIEISPAIKS